MTFRLRFVVLAIASASVLAAGCGSDDDESAGDSGQTSAELTAPTTTGDSDDSTAANDEFADAFLAYRVTGPGLNPEGLGLVIDAGGRAIYGISADEEVEFRLSPREMDRLRAVLERVDFEQLPDVIEPEPGQEVPDAGEIEVAHDGQVVREIPGSPRSALLPVHTAVARIISQHAGETAGASPPGGRRSSPNP